LYLGPSANIDSYDFIASRALLIRDGGQLGSRHRTSVGSHSSTARPQRAMALCGSALSLSRIDPYEPKLGIERIRMTASISDVRARRTVKDIEVGSRIWDGQLAAAAADEALQCRTRPRTLADEHAACYG
jgi:hypothetical protein